MGPSVCHLHLGSGLEKGFHRPYDIGKFVISHGPNGKDQGIVLDAGNNGAVGLAKAGFQFHCRSAHGPDRDAPTGHDDARAGSAAHGIIDFDKRYVSRKSRRG